MSTEDKARPMSAVNPNKLIRQFAQIQQNVSSWRVKDDYGYHYDDNRYYRLRHQEGGPIDLSHTSDRADSPGAGSPSASTQIPIIIQPGKVKVLTGHTLNAIGYSRIRQYVDQGQLSVRDLVIDAGVNYTIRNETAKLIGIPTYDLADPQQSEPLIISPFGSRWLNSEYLKDYDFLNWKRTKLILVEPMIETKPNETVQRLGRLLVILFGLFLLVSIPLAISPEQTISRTAIGVASAVFVVLLAAIYILSLTEAERKSKGSSLWAWLILMPGIALVLLAGVGLPLWIVYSFGDGRRLLESGDFSLPLLGRLIQIGFISIAAILPALLYYLFGRQQIEKLRENFAREMVILDPHVHTLSEARTKYDPLLDSVYGAGNSSSPLAIVLLVISTALLVMGWVMVFSPIGLAPSTTGSLAVFITPNYTVFTLGFLGTYFFAVNMIFRRYVRADLTPKTYAYITVRLLITLVLVWAISAMPEFGGGKVIEAGLLTIAFVIGIFPETGLALIMDRWKKITRMSGQDADDRFPLSDLEGMNLYDQARLLEEGIENMENLAHHNLVEMIARTRIPTPRLVDMFDQAILYLHLGLAVREKASTDPADKSGPAGSTENKSMTGKDLLNQLKSYGIRTATDLIDGMAKDGDYDPQTLEKIFDIERLKVIVAALKDDEWLDYVKNWRNASRRTNPITDPYKFYYIDSTQETP